jgi:hypothetical protein
MYLKHWYAVSVCMVVQDIGTHVQTLVELLLLLVDYAEAKVDLVGLFEVGFHAHHLREGFFGMLKRSVAVIQDSNPVPELGFLQQC